MRSNQCFIKFNKYIFLKIFNRSSNKTKGLLNFRYNFMYMDIKSKKTTFYQKHLFKLVISRKYMISTTNVKYNCNQWKICMSIAVWTTLQEATKRSDIFCWVSYAIITLQSNMSDSIDQCLDQWHLSCTSFKFFCEASCSNQ